MRTTLIVSAVVVAAVFFTGSAVYAVRRARNEVIEKERQQLRASYIDFCSLVVKSGETSSLSAREIQVFLDGDKLLTDEDHSHCASRDAIIARARSIGLIH